MSSSFPLPQPPSFFVQTLRDLGKHLRDSVIQQIQTKRLDALSEVADLEGEGDILYAMDQCVKEPLLAFIEQEIAPYCPCVLVAEGVSGREGLHIGKKSSPKSSPDGMRIIIDPIDGTRCLMSDKRSAWVLCGVAPDRGTSTALSDIVVAAQTEIPTTKQWRADQLWAVRGNGAQGVWEDLRSGDSGPLIFQPSRASDLLHGFASFSRFFPGARGEIAAIEDALYRQIFGSQVENAPLIFEDQYLTTGGQLYELTQGRDRLIADLRPLVSPQPHCCHPYDLASVLIAEEAGVIVTDHLGRPLHYVLDTESNCCWIGYANEAIRQLVEPTLQQILRERRLL